MTTPPSTMTAPLRKALASLKAALTPHPANDRERDGAIQRFEYTFELSWETAKRILADQGIESLSPKSIIRDLAQQGLIDNPNDWLVFLQARNDTSHTYKEDIAQKVFAQIGPFARACERLLSAMENLSH